MPVEQQRKLNAIGGPFDRVLWPIFVSDILTAGRGRIVLLHLIQKLDYHCSTFPFSGTWRDTDSLCGGLWFWLIEHVTHGKSTSLDFWSIFPTSHSGFSDISIIKRDDTLLVSRSSSQHIAQGKGLIENNVYLVTSATAFGNETWGKKNSAIWIQTATTGGCVDIPYFGGSKQTFITRVLAVFELMQHG